MDDDEEFSFQLELLSQSADPDENNLSSIFNSDSTSAVTAANTNNLANDEFSLDHASQFSSAAVNIPTNPRTSNNPPAMPTAVTTATSSATYNNVVSFPPSQSPTASLGNPSMEDPSNMNWPAIAAFLNGQVRPGADVRHVYRCHVCGAEYVNPQALGGHMGMHRRNKNNRGEGTSSKTGHSKKRRHQ